MDKPKQTLVEEGTELKGTLKSRCQVVVNGSIDGQIEAPALTVTRSGSVLGTVRAEKLHSEGTLAGDIDADDVFLSGTVRSNTMIRARTLEVKLAPEKGKLKVTFGECLLEVGDDPANKPATDTKSSEQTPQQDEGAMLADASSSKEPSWSDPPAAPSAETAATEQNATGETQDPSVSASWSSSEDESGDVNGQKKKKRNKNRESQIPPA